MWRSDGTVAGTALVKDIRPLGGNALPGELTALGATLYFTADDGVHVQELWKTDGSSTGTMMVADLRFGSASAAPLELTVFNGAIFFAAVTDAAGYESHPPRWFRPATSSSLRPTTARMTMNSGAVMVRPRAPRKWRTSAVGPVMRRPRS